MLRYKVIKNKFVKIRKFTIIIIYLRWIPEFSVLLWRCSCARNIWRDKIEGNEMGFVLFFFFFLDERLTLDIRVILVILLLKYTELVCRLFNLYRWAMAYQYNFHTCVGLVQFFHLNVFTRLSTNNPWYSTDCSLLFCITNWLLVLNPVGSSGDKRLKITAQILFCRYARLSYLDRDNRRAVHVASCWPAAVDYPKTNFNGRGSLNNT